MQRIIRDSYELVEQQIEAEGRAMEEAYNRLKAKEDLQQEAILKNKEELQWLFA